MTDLATTGPCADWITEDDLACSTEGIDPAVLAAVLTGASHVAWAFSGRRFGQCEATLYPLTPGWGCAPPSGIAWSAGWPWSSGGWSRRGRVLNLGQQVAEVTEVTVDGATFTDWRLEDSLRLVRTDGHSWPRTTRTEADLTEFVVEVVAGLTVPDLGRLAAAELACEVLRSLSGEDCRLPANVTSIIRQGVSVALAEPGVFLNEGRTGLYLVDLFIQTYNPAHLTAPSAVYPIDAPAPRRVAP